LRPNRARLGRPAYRESEISFRGGDGPRSTLVARTNKCVQGELILNFPKMALLRPFTDLCRLPHVWNAHCGEKLNRVARLDRLGYRSAGQLLAEKFHTSEEMIKLVNRGKRLDSAGIVIIVPNVADGRPDGQVFRIEVDKPAKVARAIGRNDELIAFYPASIGSREKPAQSGTYRVRQVVENPSYHYDPKFHFKGVRSKRKLTIAPGPNNPIGLVWIDLTKASYGIHGTSRPEEIGKTQSHGCIRLTNWDALDLAKRVRRGTPVAFLDETQAASLGGRTRADQPGLAKRE
jgi:lipoprotein-anchoring transpeptidase ErfK/SrfK